MAFKSVFFVFLAFCVAISIEMSVNREEIRRKLDEAKGIFESMNKKQNRDPIFNVTQLIQAQGYPVENHVIQTSDGFLLNIQRIPYGKNSQNKTNRPVVFLQHGLLDSAATWVVNSATESLGFILADAGFDVWLGNARGNTYSGENVKYSGADLWNLVDWDNMAAIDLPAVLNKALEISGQKTLSYVGHSQGTITGFGAFPLQPDLAAKVDVFIALAPVAYVQDQTSLLLTFLADLDIVEWLLLFGEEEFLPSDWVIQLMAGTVCKVIPEICYDFIFLLCGYNKNNLNASREQVYFDVTPAGTSVRNMQHWSQLVINGQFQMFDYGSAAKNQQHYGQPTPPLYQLGNLHHPPIALFTGTNDDLADPADVLKLLSDLPDDNKPVIIHNEASYEHLDFTWGIDASVKIYPQVVKLAQKYSKTK